MITDNGKSLSAIIYPLVVDGAINGELFLAYVQQILLPTLEAVDLVVMDNLSSHKVAGVWANCVTFFLPKSAEITSKMPDTPPLAIVQTNF